MKTNIKIIVALIIGVILSTFFSCCFAETLINSKDVVYEDNSNLAAENVQDAIDGTCSKVDTRLSDIEDKLYNVKEIKGSKEITTTTDITYTGLSITFPAKSYCTVSIIAMQRFARAVRLVLTAEHTLGSSVAESNNTTGNHISIGYSAYFENESTYYIYAQYAAVSSNPIYYSGFCATKYK